MSKVSSKVTKEISGEKNGNGPNHKRVARSRLAAHHWITTLNNIHQNVIIKCKNRIRHMNAGTLTQTDRQTDRQCCSNRRAYVPRLRIHWSRLFITQDYNSWLYSYGRSRKAFVVWRKRLPSCTDVMTSARKPDLVARYEHKAYKRMYWYYVVFCP